MAKMNLFLGVAFLTISAIRGDWQEPLLAEPEEIPCPIPSCLPAGPCRVPLKVSSFIMNGKRCEMCLYCPEEGRSTQKRTSPIIVKPYFCPEVMCYPPGPCDVPLKLGKTSTGCPLCPYCPTAKRDLKKRTSEPIIMLPRPCPAVGCEPPGPCKVDLKLGHDDHGCPLCWYCPAAARELKKRTSEPITLPRLCQEVACEPPRPCKVDLKLDHDDNGCPLCWYCPAAASRGICNQIINCVA